jgi:tight adherence protein C
MDINLGLTMIAIFTSVALVVGSLTYVGLERSSSQTRRLRDLLRPHSARQAGSSELTRLNEAPGKVLSKIGTFIPKSPKAMSKLQRHLALAGLHKGSHAVVYGLSEVVGALVGFLGPVLIMGWSSGMLFGVLGAIVGYLVPSFVLERRIKLRQKRIQNGLPDALDLLIVCLEAGLALDGALLKCSEELGVAHPELAGELRLINVETRAGKPRLEAFKNFALRTKVDDVRSLVAMLIQTDRFGTSVAQALRTHAEVSRTKRRQRAEERAAKIGVKMVFPLVFCLFPAFYVVTLGPAVIKFTQAFGAGGFISGGLGQ